MPRKPFEDTPYDPIAADLAREVAAAGRAPVAAIRRPITDRVAQPEQIRIDPPPPTQPSPRPRAWPTAPITRHPRSQVPPQSATTPPPPPSTNRDRDLTSTRGPSPTITKRFVVSRAEDTDLNAFLVRLQQATGTKVPLSVIVRALLTLAMQSESNITELLAIHPVRLPSTHDTLALGEFEAIWTSVLASAMAARPGSESSGSRFAVRCAHPNISDVAPTLIG